MSGVFRLALAAAILAPGPAMAAGAAASAGGLAAAEVVSPATVRQLADLDFGALAANAGSPGEVVLAPGGAAATYLGGARQACIARVACPAPHAARFEVSGEANRAYTIAAPESITASGLVLSPLPGEVLLPVLRVEAFRVRSASRPEAGPAGRLDAAGRDLFELGGTLRVPAALPPARYRVTVPVIVTYG